MVSTNTKSIIDQAKHIYTERLRATLEPGDHGRYVAIEPKSGEHFLADTIDAAVQAARFKYPDRVSHTMRIGHPVALHLGSMSW